VNHDVEYEIDELTAVHCGLVRDNAGDQVVLSGQLPFEASADGFETITDNFDIELTIPGDYSETLPAVKETAGRIDRTYDHVYQDGSFCLAVPIEERRIFWEQPTLLGFVNNLVVPYLYSYCHWKRTGTYPFGDRPHGSEGILQHYLDSSGFQDETAVLAVLSFLFEHGYRGHHPCPCGSGIRARKCHGPELRTLQDQHTSRTLQHDFIAVLEVCLTKMKNGDLCLSEELKKQVLRILKRRKLH